MQNPRVTIDILTCVSIVVVSTHQVTERCYCLLVFHLDWDIEQSRLWSISFNRHTPLWTRLLNNYPPRKKYHSNDTMIPSEITAFSPLHPRKIFKVFKIFQYSNPQKIFKVFKIINPSENIQKSKTSDVLTLWEIAWNPSGIAWNPQKILCIIVGRPTLAKRLEKTFDGIFFRTIVDLVFSRQTGFEIARIEFIEKWTAKCEPVVLNMATKSLLKESIYTDEVLPRVLYRMSVNISNLSKN